MRAILRRFWTGGYAIALLAAVLALSFIPGSIVPKVGSVLVGTCLCIVAIAVDLRRRPPLPSIQDVIRDSMQFDRLGELSLPCVGIVTDGPRGCEYFTAVALDDEAECILLGATGNSHSDQRVEGTRAEIEIHLRRWGALVLTSEKDRVRTLKALEVKAPSSTEIRRMESR